jgi:hypothetical protein
MDKIRVLRVIEYVGPRDQVEKQIALSIHGDKIVHDMTIRVATVGVFPEILETDVEIPHG